MKLALAILSFRRHEFLRLMLETLQRNAWPDNVDVWLFQDNVQSGVTGKWYGKEKEVEASLETFHKAALPRKHVHQQPVNVGPLVQTCDAFEVLFGEGYGFVMLVPNDLVVGKFYVKTIATLAEQFEGEEEVGLLHTLPVATKQLTLGEFKAYRCELDDKLAWGSPEAEGGRIDQGMWRRTWDAIAEDAGELKAMALGLDFIDLAVPVMPEHEAIADEMIRRFGAAQADLVLPMLAENHGLRAIHTLSPRACHIAGAGAYGTVPNFPLDLVSLEWCDKDIWLWDVGDREHYQFQKEG